MPWVWENPIPLMELADGTVVCHVQDWYYRFQFEDRDEGWLSFDIRELGEYRADWRNKDDRDLAIKALRYVSNKMTCQGKSFKQWLLDHHVELCEAEG